jgi:hypothetical protein
MIYRDLKYQGNPTLDYQCRLKKRRRAGGKIALFWGAGTSGRWMGTGGE